MDWTGCELIEAASVVHPQRLPSRKVDTKGECDGFRRAAGATVDRVVTCHDVLAFRLEVLTERVDKMAAKIDKLVDVVASHEHRLEQIRT